MTFSVTVFDVDTSNVPYPEFAWKLMFTDLIKGLLDWNGKCFPCVGRVKRPLHR